MHKITSHRAWRGSDISRAETHINMGWHQEDRQGKVLSSGATFVKIAGWVGQKGARCEVLAQALTLIIAPQWCEA